MNDEAFIVLGGFIVTLITIVTPIVKLNITITKMTDAINNINEILKKRIEEEEKIKLSIQDHEVRIDRLERP